MVVGIVKIRIYAPWVHSLKEKRMVVKSLCAKVRNKYNVTIAETENQDVHQSIVLGFSCVSNDNSHADQILDTVIKFIEGSTEGEIVKIERELIRN
jgi:uncharacterized protein YlxP (DUF503 family)